MRCQMCFKDKPVTPVLPGSLAQVCRGCFVEVDRVLGFLSMVADRAEGDQVALPDLGSQLETPLPPFDGVTATLEEAPASTEKVTSDKKAMRTKVGA